MKDIIWHKHHIVPRHAGGTNNPSNLIKCNIAMHGFLHKELYKRYGRWQDKLAYEGLLGLKPIQQIHLEKNILNGKSSKGRQHTQEAKDKISIAQTGKFVSSASRKKMSDAKKGKLPPCGGGHCRTAISTPYGDFDTVKDCWLTIKYGQRTVYNRLNDDRYPEWYRK